jgi:putative (di)nucleoside polyphosphate hydrolase
MTLPYRPCVGIMLLNAQNNVFVARRIDSSLEAWQMPQGGIDEGETPIEAAQRELMEEIGTNHAQIIAQSPDWLRYDLPEDLVPTVWGGKYRGQEQQWFLFRFLGNDSDININTPHPEFCEWKWANPQDLPNLIVPFKRQLYIDILKVFSPHIG